MYRKLNMSGYDRDINTQAKFCGRGFHQMQKYFGELIWMLLKYLNRQIVQFDISIPVLTPVVCFWCYGFSGFLSDAQRNSAVKIQTAKVCNMGLLRSRQSSKNHRPCILCRQEENVCHKSHGVCLIHQTDNYAVFSSRLFESLLNV